MRSFLVLAALFVVTSALAQTQLEPVKWNFSLGEDGGVYAVLAQAEVAEGWFIYSQFIDDGGPIPTSIDLTETDGITLRGPAVEEGDKIAGYDKLFEMEVAKFKHHASFTQAFDLADAGTPVVGYLEFMACTDKKCLPPSTVSFEFATAQ